MSQLTSTGDHGVDEVLRALLYARGRNGNLIAPWRLRRHLGPRQTTAEITTILTGLGADARIAHDGSGNFTLTATGVAYARGHRPHRRVTVI